MKIAMDSRNSNNTNTLLGILTAMGALLLWYASSLAIDEKVLPRSFDYLIQILTVAVGGFIGAFSAFKFKEFEERKKDELHQKSALLSRVFTLFRQVNALHQVMDIYDQFKGIEEGWRSLILPSFDPPDHQDLIRDSSDLEFLLDAGKTAELMQLVLNQQRFEAVMNSIRDRNEFYVDSVQPILGENNIASIGEDYSKARRILGEYLFLRNQTNTNDTYDLLYKAVADLEKQYHSFIGTAESLYPDVDFRKDFRC